MELSGRFRFISVICRFSFPALNQDEFEGSVWPSGGRFTNVIDALFSLGRPVPPTVILEFINLFFSGILAGALFVIHYGVRTPLSLLDERSQLKMRQALILRLRILIPAFFGSTILSGIVVVLLDWSGPGYI